MAMRGRRRPDVVQRLIGAFVVLFVAAPRALAVPLGEGGSLKGIADDELAPSVSWVDSARRLEQRHDFTGLAAAPLDVPDGRRAARRDAPKGRPGPRLVDMVAALRDELKLDAALSLEETIDAAHKQLGIVDAPDGAGLRRKAELAYRIVAKGTASCVAFCFLVGSPTRQSLLPKRPRLWHDFFREGTRKGLAHVVRLHTAVPVGEILSGAAAKRHRVRLGAEIFDFFRERCSDRTVSTSWGGVGLVRATLVLWRDAIAQDPSVTHFALLSDSCVPLAGFESVWRVVAGLERTTINGSPEANPDYWNNLKDQALIAPGHRRKMQQWFVARRGDADWFLANDFTYAFDKFWVSDERYFVSLMSQHGRPYGERKLTYTYWCFEEGGKKCNVPPYITRGDSGNHPGTFNRVEAAIAGALWAEGYIFLRKVDHETIFETGWNHCV